MLSNSTNEVEKLNDKLGEQDMQLAQARGERDGLRLRLNESEVQNKQSNIMLQEMKLMKNNFRSLEDELNKKLFTKNQIEGDYRDLQE